MELFVGDLFCGAGGCTLGFELATQPEAALTYRSVFAADHDPNAVRTYERNFGIPARLCDISEMDACEVPDVDVIVGGPPCQGFSPLGAARDPDERSSLNGMWEHYLRMVVAKRPLAFVVENVPEFHHSPQFREFLRRMRQDAFLSEFDFAFGVLNAADYGVPQHRRRGIFLAVRGRRVTWPPAPTHHAGPMFGAMYVTVRDAIGDLSATPTSDCAVVSPDGTQDLHVHGGVSAVARERYAVIPPGGNRFDLQRERPDLARDCWMRKPTGTRDVMGRMWWDRPAPTIRTDARPDKGRYLHPEMNRPITLREAARLQSFPDSFVFEGSYSAIGRQIGNAVPPLLAKSIALHLANAISAPEPEGRQRGERPSTPAAIA